MATEVQPYWGNLSFASRIHSFLGLSQCHGASGSGLSCLLCLSLCQAPWSTSSVMACASAALTVRSCPGGTRARGLQSPVLASHSPKASSNAIKGKNLPLPTCCHLESLEWEKMFLVTRPPSDDRIILMSDPTMSESALHSGRERSLKSSASLISVRWDTGPGSLRLRPAGRLCQVSRTCFISAHPTLPFVCQYMMCLRVDPSCSPPPREMPYDVPVWLRPLPREGGPGHSPTNSLVIV